MSEATEVLAKYPGLGSVRLCGCNTIHLQVGAVTVCLAPAAFAQAAILMRDAMEQLRALYNLTESDLEDPLPTPAAHSGWKH